MLLQDKIALVYGAGGAVGGAVAQAFAREGARVILAGRTAASLEKVAGEIHGRGGWAAVAPVDALNAAAIESHLDGVLRKTGPVKVMFNAIAWDDVQGQALVDMRPEDFAVVTETALKTWFLTGTAAARQMMAHGGGTIVGITANAGRTPIPMVGGFGVACAAVEQFLRQLAVEAGPFGVRVCFVRSAGSPEAPGLAEIFQRVAMERGVSLQTVLDEMSSGIPLRHMPSLAEVANAAVLMASDLASGMTATVANVTCGAVVD